MLLLTVCGIFVQRTFLKIATDQIGTPKVKITGKVKQ